jgi:drug/metabolite transporter (DMT)-like permease
MGALSGRRLVVYLALCAVWGSTWLVIKIGLRDLPPLLFAGVRMGVACVLLAPLAFFTRGPRLTAREKGIVAVAGWLQIGLAYALVFLAEQRIDSGLAALLFATFPIWAGLFAHFLLPGEPLTRRNLGAAALGLSGVALIEWPALRSAASASGRALLVGGACMLGSAVSAALGNVLFKKYLGRVTPARNVWGETLVGSLFLLASSFLFERNAPAAWTGSAVLSLLYLTLFGTVAAFLGLFWLIPRVPVAVIGTIPLVDTWVAVLLGALLLKEHLSGRILLGGALILLGVFLVVSQKPDRESPPVVRNA